MITDRKSTRLNSSHTDIYTLSLHDALPIYSQRSIPCQISMRIRRQVHDPLDLIDHQHQEHRHDHRSEEHTSELQSHRYLHSLPTRRSSDLFTTLDPMPNLNAHPAAGPRSA